MQFKNLAALNLTMLFAGHLAFSQGSLANRVLLVYDSTDANSRAVAGHYQAVRNVPQANVCAISPPALANILAADYTSYVRNPVRACLNAVGKQNILYIVLAYVRPLTLQTPSGDIYAIDAFLSDAWDAYTTQLFNPVPTAVHRYYAEIQSQGNSFVPFQSFAAYRASTGAQLIYSVWRLDGAAPGIASAQVDNAIAAEAAGGLPVGSNACIDLTYLPAGVADSGYGTGNWDLLRVGQMLQNANRLNLVQDSIYTSFGVGSSPACPNTALYNGWYNYGTYNDAFTWVKGSVGWDLDSGALFDTRSGTWWGPNAIARGVTVTSGPVTEPYLEGIPRPAVIRNLLEGANVGDAFLRNTRWLKWKIVNVGDPLYRPFPNGAPVAASNALAVVLNQTTFRQFIGGLPLAVTVSANAPAPSGGLTLALSTNASGLNFPASVTIPAGQTSVSVAGTSSPVTAPVDVQMTASGGSFSATNTVSLYPLLAGVALSSGYAKGGGTLQAAAALYSNAALGGTTVQMSSDNPNLVTLPASVTVPEGLVQAGFTITTKAVATNTNVNITSTYAGASNTVTLTLTP